MSMLSEKKRARSISTKNYGPLGALVGDEHAANILSPPGRLCLAPEHRVVIPNGCEGSKISPCGRNDTSGQQRCFWYCDTICDGRIEEGVLGSTFVVISVSPPSQSSPIEGEEGFFLFELSSNKMLRSCVLYREEESNYADTILPPWICAQRSRSG